MNCKRCQEKILDSLLSGEEILTTVVLEHRRFCARCEDFYVSQQALLRSMDAGLHAIANQPIPSSLLPQLRPRLDEQLAASLSASPSWRFVAAVAVLVLSLAYAFRRPDSPAHAPKFAAAPSRDASPQQHAQLNVSPESPAVVFLSKHKNSSVETKSSVPRDVVIVPAGQRQALARLAGQPPFSQIVAAPAENPEPAEPQDSVNIALVEIDTVEVQPLESTVGE
jgi:hypothetical protein